MVQDLVLTNLTAEGPKPVRARVQPPPEAKQGKIDWSQEDDDKVVMEMEEEEEDINRYEEEAGNDISEGTKAVTECTSRK